MSIISNFIPYNYELLLILCYFIYIYLHSRSNVVNDLLSFNPSNMYLAPESPILLSIIYINSFILLDWIYLHARYNLVNDLLSFNTSYMYLAPVSPILFPIIYINSLIYLLD